MADIIRTADDRARTNHFYLTRHQWRSFKEAIPPNGSVVWWARETGETFLVKASNFCDEDIGLWMYPEQPAAPWQVTP